MKLNDMHTKVPNTWCPACPNFMILSSAKKAIMELINEKYAKQSDFAAVTGIGCHGKLYDYINIGGFYGLHGRAIPAATGLVLGNPALKVIAFAGDGDAYAEGISHFINSARMNPNYALFVHNNKVFALTTGQITPTSEKGYLGKSTPKGNPLQPINPIALALEAGASFVAREYALDVKNLTATMKAAIKHKGFAYVDIIQPCLTFHNFTDYIQDRTYRIKTPKTLEAALKYARVWDYSLSKKAKIPVGIFYRENRPTLEESFDMKTWYKVKRTPNMRLWERLKVK